MSSSTIAPTVATRIDHTLNPVAPVPPKIPNTKPPTTAPTIPITAVTIMPPGSSPGSTSLASAPAINPTTIQLMMPIFSLALLSEGLSLLLGVDSTIIYVGVLVNGGVVGRLLAPAVTVCSTGVYISQMFHPQHPHQSAPTARGCPRRTPERPRSSRESPPLSLAKASQASRRRLGSRATQGPLQSNNPRRA